MKAFEIFRAGRQTSASGSTIEFGEDQLRAAVAAYDPAIHEAPIVVGHPKDNGPAYGWIKSLSFADGVISADPIQVDAEFAEMVANGRFKKRSASFYTPDSPQNPKPGVFYLRHVGFLGAQPPAVKGLKDVSFSDDDAAGIVEFTDPGLMAGIFRRLREFVISKFSIDDADQLIPAWVISDLDAESRAANEQAIASLPAFSETGDTNMDFKEEHAKEKARADGLQAQLDAATAQTADFAEREKSLKTREAEIERRDLQAEIDVLVKAGKILPAQRDQIADFAMSLNSADLVIDFKEGEKTEKVSLRAAYLKQIAAGPKVIEYGERSGDEGGEGESKPSDLATANAGLLKQVASGGAK